MRRHPRPEPSAARFENLLLFFFLRGAQGLADQAELIAKEAEQRGASQATTLSETAVERSGVSEAGREGAEAETDSWREGALPRRGRRGSRWQGAAPGTESWRGA